MSAICRVDLVSNTETLFEPNGSSRLLPRDGREVAHVDGGLMLTVDGRTQFIPMHQVRSILYAHTTSTPVTPSGPAMVSPMDMPPVPPVASESDQGDLAAGQGPRRKPGRAKGA
jgi:hypothetical protein